MNLQVREVMYADDVFREQKRRFYEQKNEKSYQVGGRQVPNG